MLRKSPQAPGIITEHDAISVLEPHHKALFGVVAGAFERFIDGPLSLTPTPTINYKTSAMHDLIEDRSRQAFGSTEGVEIVEDKNFLLKIEDRVFLRFKKVDKELRTRNYPTSRSLMFDGQQTVDGLGQLPRLTVGYQPNDTWSELVAIAVVFSISNRVMWNYELTGETAKVQSFSPLAEKVFVRPKANLELFQKRKK